MEKTIKIHLKFAKNSHYVYSGMHIPEEMEASELLKIIEANELIGCNHHTGHPKFNEKYRNSGKLENERIYDVHTPDVDRTLDLIKSYKDK